MTTFFRLLALLPMLSPLLTSGTASAAPNAIKSEPAFYAETYGEVRPEDDPEVARAHQVFDTVRAVADKSAKRLPRLVVVRSKADPWAIALPSGHIILSKEAVSICHRQASTAEAEARLAFVLGHELAHLAHDDFWHQEVYSFLTQHSGTQNLAHFMLTQERGQDQELKADDKGFVYAAIAGYPMETLLAKGEASSDFFNYWLAQTSARTQTSHLAANVRADRHQQRLRELQGKLAFFHFGVRLSHFDYCDDAVYFFKEFQKTYPGREVLNNLGYCQLQMARREMKPEHADFYWMPALLDGQVRGGGSGTRGENQTLKALRQAGLGKAEPYLTDAAEYLQQAAKADPGYVPARLNLAIAQLYLGQPHQARAVLDEARQLAPDNADIQVLEALTLYEQSDSGLDLWPNAVERLEKLAARREASPVALFNLARLNAIRPRAAEAKTYWNRLAAYTDTLPYSILAVVCQNQTDDGPHSGCKRAAGKPAQPAPWHWPVPTADFKQISQPFLPDWQKTEFDWVKDKLHGHIYRQPDGMAEVLELDQFVHMQVLHGENLGKVNDLSRYCAGPLRHRSLAQGEVWSCDHWAALAMGDRVEEIWWVAK